MTTIVETLYQPEPLPLQPCPAAPATHLKGLVCQVEGCGGELRKAYHKRYRICPNHQKADCALINGVMQRFCQLCSCFHPVTEFDGAKRSCRDRLETHNKRRRIRRMQEHKRTLQGGGMLPEEQMDAGDDGDDGNYERELGSNDSDGGDGQFGHQHGTRAAGMHAAAAAAAARAAAAGPSDGGAAALYAQLAAAGYGMGGADQMAHLQRQATAQAQRLAFERHLMAGNAAYGGAGGPYGAQQMAMMQFYGGAGDSWGGGMLPRPSAHYPGLPVSALGLGSQMEHPPAGCSDDAYGRLLMQLAMQQKDVAAAAPAADATLRPARPVAVPAVPAAAAPAGRDTIVAGLQAVLQAPLTGAVTRDSSAGGPAAEPPATVGPRTLLGDAAAAAESSLQDGSPARGHSPTDSEEHASTGEGAARPVLPKRRASGSASPQRSHSNTCAGAGAGIAAAAPPAGDASLAAAIGLGPHLPLLSLLASSDLMQRLKSEAAALAAQPGSQNPLLAFVPPLLALLMSMQAAAASVAAPAMPADGSPTASSGAAAEAAPLLQPKPSPSAVAEAMAPPKAAAAAAAPAAAAPSSAAATAMEIAAAEARARAAGLKAANDEEQLRAALSHYYQAADEGRNARAAAAAAATGGAPWDVLAAMMGGAQQACYPLPGAAPAGARMPLAGNWAAAMQGLAPPPSAWYGGMPQGMPPQGSAMHGLPPGLMAPGGAYSMPFAALSNNLPGAAMGYAMDLDAAQVGQKRRRATDAMDSDALDAAAALQLLGHSPAGGSRQKRA